MRSRSLQSSPRPRNGIIPRWVWVFTIPGISRLLLASISNRDFPVVQAIVVVVAAWIVIVNFVADLLYQLVDPRIRLQ